MPTIVNAANCAVATGSGGVRLITKTGGVAGAADASAVSLEALSGDFLLRVRLLGEGTAYAGVTADPAVGNDHVGIQRALQLGSVSARPCESGALRQPIFSIVGFAWIRRVGATLDYATGADPSALSVKRTVAGVTGPLKFDCSILTPGVPLEIKFDVPAAFVQPKPISFDE